MAFRSGLAAVFTCSILLNSSFACLPGLSGGGSGGCCPPGPSCHQTTQCAGSYVSPPVVGPSASYAAAPSSYAQPPASAPKYPTAGR